ncbi:hypothetical protein RHGRI_001913 [Rhododendron griersonianum]|uniref:Uncharacterized protein n=1 Tax=Rhododendron griersonianum TaxID=479676 RepID=A0AAV6LLV1_9ERIC|nr:hypothetical protein RHGRI_001913 [Rhododendron griersonianum]
MVLIEVGESSKSNITMEACEALVTGTLRVVSEGGCEMFPFGSFVKSEKMEMRERAGKTLAPPGGLKRPSIAGYQQRKKRDGDASLGDVPKPLCPSSSCPFSMEEDPLSSSPSSCVTASPVPEPRQLSFADSSSDRVGDVFQDIASRPRNLRTKRIMPF